jgi:hypothetical protein
MTREALYLVAVDGDAAQVAVDLHRRSAAALIRARKAAPGERTDFIRYETAQAQLEALALAALNSGSPSVGSPGLAGPVWSVLLEEDTLIPESVLGQVRSLRGTGRVIIAVTCPFVFGSTPTPVGAGGPLPPARRFTEGEGLPGVEAVRARFRQQVATVAYSSPNDVLEPIIPSGVSNSVLTESFREFVANSRDRNPLWAPISYRDGSAAQDFALGALLMPPDLPPPSIDDTSWMITKRTLRMTLLSIRHVELDLIVDGAWLRNSVVSRPRPQALTDQLVYQVTTEQLERLTRRSPVNLLIFQTGLEPAVTGFYRALTDHLLDKPGTVAVLPVYYRKADEYRAGTPWRSR